MFQRDLQAQLGLWEGQVQVESRIRPRVEVNHEPRLQATMMSGRGLTRIVPRMTARLTDICAMTLTLTCGTERGYPYEEGSRGRSRWRSHGGLFKWALLTCGTIATAATFLKTHSLPLRRMVNAM